jgi:predicted nuclease with TOPRIM domain
MREQVEQRLHELKAEWETGQQMLAELETKQAHLRETLLRISGAMQVLEEMLGEPQPGHTSGVPSAQSQSAP